MSQRYPGGLITKTPVTPTSSAAPGVWTLAQALQYIKAGTWPLPPPVDPFFNQTTLLLHGDGNQGVTNFNNLGPPTYLAFSDNSSNDFPITVNGDAYGNPFSPYSLDDGEWSNYFDGTGDYLSVANNAAFDFGTGSLTVEAWIYTGVKTDFQSVIGTFDGGSNAWGIHTNASGTITYFINSSTPYTASIQVCDNSWHHVAMVRNGASDLKLYVDGVLDDSQTDSTNVNTNAEIRIGSLSSGATRFFTGYISNIRVTTTAVYTSAFTPLTAPLTAVSGTELLTCQSNRFVDNSTNNFAITANGNVAVKTFNPFNATIDGTAGSGYFDGTGDYLTVPAGAAFAPGTNDFTIEAWVYPTNANQQFIWTQSVSGTNYFVFYFDSSTASLIMTASGGGTAINGPASSMRQFAWNHVAAVRSGGTVTVYVNGVGGTPTVNTLNLNNTTFVPTIGAYTHATSVLPLTGYITSLRYVNGTAVYTSAFTPPAAPFEESDEANTELLTCQYQGTVRNIGFIDSSPNNFTIARNGNTTQGTFSPFSLAEGQWSNYFVDNSDRLSATVTAPGTGDFTVEAWVWFGSVGSNQIIFSFGSNAPAIYYRNATSELAVYDGGAGGAFYLSGFTPEANTWYHIAFTRSGTDSRLFVDGVQKGATTTYSANITSTTFNIAYDGVDYFGGYLSNVRYVNGTALYTSAFTPSTTPLTAISGTELLTCQSNRFVDNSTNAFAITVNGNPSVQPFSPFAPSAAYSPSVNGGSGYFDGSGDYLSVANSANLNLGSSSFTIEFWVYASSSASSKAIVSKGNVSSLGSEVWSIEFTNTSGGLAFYSGAFNNLSAAIVSGTVRLNAWNHVAVVRSGTTHTMYINGASVATNTASYTVTSAGLLYMGTGWYAPATRLMTGNLSNLRIVIGTAVYTTTFTPPTAPVTAITNTQLLTNFTNAGIFDNTGKNVLETVGNAQIDTSVKKYGTGSMEFDGTGDYLVIPSNENFNLGSGDFTIEFWVYIDSLAATRYLFTINGATVLLVYASSAGRLGVQGGASAYIETAASTLTTATWYHIAVTKISTNTYTIYLDGVAQATPSTAGTMPSSYPIGAVGIGASSGGSLPHDGYIDDLRITKGVARYTTTFTPPTQAFPNL